MILVKLQGGIGNQMFQYAFGRALSIKLNVPLKFDLSFLNIKTNRYTLRNFELNVFNIDAEIATQAEVNKFTSIYENRLLRRLNSLIPLSSYCTLKETQHGFMPQALETAHKNLYLIGFWQSFNYFKSIENIIQKDFQFKASLSGANAELSKQIENSNSVSMHIRRGDYVKNPETMKYHGNCDKSYYDKALSYITAKNSDVKLFIFSDEPGWVKDNWVFDHETYYVMNNTGSDSYIDMRLMSLCKHNIIANSSFSWWGAWLNGNPSKIIIAPQQWIADQRVNTSDVIPSEWIRI